MSEQPITQKSFASAMDRPSLLRVREKHSDVSELIGSLNEKLTALRADQEKEFLSAYRVHMLNVQLELKELSSKVAKAEEFLQDDIEVSKLEDECKWFGDQVGRLDKQARSMLKDMKHMQTRVMALREQRTYLNDQLKLTMKRSRVLEASVKNEQISEAEPARGMSQHFFLPPAQTEVPILQNVSTLSQQPSSSALFYSKHVAKLNPNSSYRQLPEENEAPQQRGKDNRSNKMKKKSYSTSNLPQPPSRAAVAAAEKAAQLRTTIFEQLLLSEEEKREQENIEKTTERPRTGSPKSTRFDILQLDGEDSVDPNTNTIETPFNQTGSASGGGSPIQIRKSASNPNMSSPGRMSTSRGTSRGASRGGVSSKGGALDNKPVVRHLPGTTGYYVEELENLERSRPLAEIALESHIRGVFNQILERKALISVQSAINRAPHKVNTGKTGSKSGSTSSYTVQRNDYDVASDILSDTGKQPGGLTGLGLTHFTEQDRLAVMISFLSDPSIFRQVTQELQVRIPLGGGGSDFGAFDRSQPFDEGRYEDRDNSENGDMADGMYGLEQDQV